MNNPAYIADGWMPNTQQHHVIMSVGPYPLANPLFHLAPWKYGMENIALLLVVVQNQHGIIWHATAVVLKKHVQAELLAAKEKFAGLNGGVPYDPPKVEKKKVKGPAKTPAPDRAPGEKSKKVGNPQVYTDER